MFLCLPLPSWLPCLPAFICCSNHANAPEGALVLVTFPILFSALLLSSQTRDTEGKKKTHKNTGIGNITVFWGKYNV